MTSHQLTHYDVGMGTQVRRGDEPAVFQQQHRGRVNQGVPERGVG